MCFLHKILVFSNDKKTMFIKKNQKSMLNKSKIAISVNSLDNRRLKAIISQTQVNARMTNIEPNPCLL